MCVCVGVGACVPKYQIEHCNERLLEMYLSIGIGVGYIPSGVSSAAAHKGKLKNIHQVALRDGGCNGPGVTAVLSFEKEATKVHQQMHSTAGPSEGILVHYSNV